MKSDEDSRAPGRRYEAKMKEYDYFTLHYVMVRDRPQGIIRVSKNGRLLIHYQIHERDKQSLREGTKLSARVFFAAGARKVYLNHTDAPVFEHEKQLDIVDRLRADFILSQFK